MNFIFFSVFFVISAAANSYFTSIAFAQPPDDSQKQLLTFLSMPLPGQAKPEEAAAFYKPDSLYQYIDGGADVYLLYDFRVVVHQDFKSSGAEFTADIYDMGSPEDAYGIYAA